MPRIHSSGGLNTRLVAVESGYAQLVYNVKAAPYAATGDGVADDTAEVQAAIDAAILTGGVVYFPAGSYKITTVLDLNDLQGTNRVVTLKGAGSGNQVGAGFAGTTTLLNGTGGTLIKAEGVTAGNGGIHGVSLQNLAIRNTANIGAANWTVLLDYVFAHVHISDVFIKGGSFTGNGVAIMNQAAGQGFVERLSVEDFNSGTGIKCSVETTAGVAALNSGNTEFVACDAANCLKGWYINGDGNVVNSIVLTACKAVNSSDIAASIGFHLSGSARGCVLTAPHAERFYTGVQLDGTAWGTILTSPYCSYPTGSPAANSAAVRIAGDAQANDVQNLIASANYHYGVRFEGTSAQNDASAASNGVVTSLFSDTSSAVTNRTRNIGSAGDASSIIRLGQFNPLSLGWTGAFEADTLGLVPDAAVGTFTNMGSAGNLVQGTGGFQPLYKNGAAGINGRPALFFDGTDDLMASAGGISTYISNSAFELFVVCKVTGINTASATAYLNDGLVSDGLGQFWGLHLHSTTPTVIGYNYDGSSDTASATVATGVALVLHYRHESGNIVVSRDGGTEVSAASGNTSTITGLMTMGRGGTDTQCFSGLISAFYVTNAAMTSVNRATMTAHLKAKYGVV